MSISVESRLQIIGTLNEELFTLATTEQPTPQQSKRMAQVKGIIDSIKAGHSVEQVLNYSKDELRKQMGLPRLPDAPRTKLDADIAEEWRKFALTGECRPTQIDSETRA